MKEIIKIAFKSSNKNFGDYKLFIIINVISFVSIFFSGPYLYIVLNFLIMDTSLSIL